MWEAIALGAGLAMDATAVAALRGLQNRERDRSGRDAITLPLLFGVFQAGMTALGWALGRVGAGYVERYDHWIAFALLAGIGVKMIVGGIKGEDPDADEDASGLAVDLMLALATSIDAAAAGITISIVPVSPVVAICLIGTITWLFCVVGYAAGKAAGRHLGSRLELIGGVILVAIGARVLLQHL